MLFAVLAFDCGDLLELLAHQTCTPKAVGLARVQIQGKTTLYSADKVTVAMSLTSNWSHEVS